MCVYVHLVHSLYPGKPERASDPHEQELQEFVSCYTCIGNQTLVL